MGSFTFHTVNGGDKRIVEELPSYRAARHAALHKLASYLAREAEQPQLSGEALTLTVTDDKGMTLLQLEYSAVESPATKRQSLG